MKNLGVHPMQQLKDKLKIVLEEIPPHSKIVYLDYPVHGNGGDLLIMKGTEKFFQDYNINVLGRYSLNSFPKNKKIPSDCIIVFHGGGNFGDIYPIYQKFRESIITQYPNHKIVILPQTVYYSNQSEFEKSAKIFNAHKNLHLFVRDKNCYEVARKMLHACDVKLCPDMAHQLWPIAIPAKAEEELLYFLRLDSEVNKEQQGRSLHVKHNRDWENVFTFLEFSTIAVVQKLHRINSYAGGILPASAIWYRYSDYLVNKTCRLFSRYKLVKTSRLHGHILSCLMDKPNVLIDNSYGKNSSYYVTWTHSCPVARLNDGLLESDPA